MIKRVCAVLLLAAIMCLYACGEDNVTDSETDATGSTADASESVTRAVTTPPITAALTTGNGVVYEIEETYEVYTWDFTGGKTTGWRATNSLKKLTSTDGFLKAEITGLDPYMTTASFPNSLYCEDIQYIMLEINNRSSSMAGQLFYLTEDASNPTEPNSFAIAYSSSGADNDEWDTVYILTGSAGWTGKLIGFRFDVSNGDSGEVYVRSISLLSAENK